MGEEFFERLLLRTSKDTVVVFAGNLLSVLILALSAIIVARFLGPEGYGVYSVSLVVSSIVMIFSDFGVDAALVKFVSKFRALNRDDLVKAVVVKSLAVKVLLSAFLTVLNFILARELSNYLIGRPELADYVRLTSPLILGQVLMNTSLATFIALGLSVRRASTQVAQAALKLALSPTLIILGLGVLGALVGHVLSYFVVGVASALFVVKYVGSIKKHLSNDLIGVNELFRYGLPLFISGFIGTLLSRYQYVLLALNAGDVEIGNVQAATQFATLLSLTTTPFSITLFPMFSSLSVETHREEISKYFNAVLKYMSLFTIPLSLFMAVFSTDVVRLIYGRTYTLAPEYLTLISLGYLYAPLSTALGALIPGLGATNYVMYSSLIQALVMTPAAYALISGFGASGYALTLALAGIPPLTFMVYVVIKKVGLRVDWLCLVKVFTVSLISTIPYSALLMLHVNYVVRLALEVIAFLTTYLMLVPLIGLLELRDVELMRRSLGRLPLFGVVVNVLLDVEVKVISLRVKSRKET